MQKLFCWKRFYFYRLPTKKPGGEIRRKKWGNVWGKNTAVFRQTISFLFMPISSLRKFTNAPCSAEMTFTCHHKRVTAKNTWHQMHSPKANATSSCKCQQGNLWAGMLMGKVEPWSSSTSSRSSSHVYLFFERLQVFLLSCLDFSTSLNDWQSLINKGNFENNKLCRKDKVNICISG